MIEDILEKIFWIVIIIVLGLVLYLDLIGFHYDIPLAP